jgi:hypothetical protein
MRKSKRAFHSAAQPAPTLDIESVCFPGNAYFNLEQNRSLLNFLQGMGQFMENGMLKPEYSSKPADTSQPKQDEPHPGIAA